MMDKNSAFYKNCVSRRKKKLKACKECPFRTAIEIWESTGEQDGYHVDCNMNTTERNEWWEYVTSKLPEPTKKGENGGRFLP